MNRRRFLHTIGLGAAMEPFVPLLARDGEVHAQPAKRIHPRRLVLWFHPTGSVLSRWRPTGGERDFAFSEILKPLEPFRSHVTILDGLSLVTGGGNANHPHGRGMNACFTASFSGGGGPAAGDPTVTAKGISVDQYVAGRVGAATPFRSLLFGVTTGGVGAGDSARYSSLINYRMVPNELSPYAAFDRVFRSLKPADPTALERIRLERRSVIDVVRAEVTGLRARVGKEDSLKLDRHLQGLREMEQRLQAPAASGTCAQPSVSGVLDVTNNFANIPAIGRMHMDMIAAAFSCDLTRVASLQWSAGYPNTQYPWLNLSIHHHETSHKGPDQPGPTAQLVTINRWYSEQLAYLLAKLKEIPEGAGTALDNTIVLSSSEISTSGTHDWRSMPFVLAGGAGGAFRTGRYLRYGGQTANRLFVSLCHAMGLEDVQKYGDTDGSSGPLANLA